jgi:glycosyltransferase involved in cell wall biosynthesis
MEFSIQPGDNGKSQIPCIGVFSPASLDWQWFANDTAGHVRWIFFTEEPKSLLERHIRRPRLSRICGAFRCARSGRRQRAVAFAAHSQFNTFWLSIALSVLRIDRPLLAFSFHFSKLPDGLRLLLMKLALKRVARFTVHSEPERKRYSSHFGIPIERFDLIRWGVQPESVLLESGQPLIPGPYICALGKDGRDYRTLVRAMERIPELTLVLVAQPHNLKAVTVPPNVKLFLNIAREAALNILMNSQFMALPLETSETSCGHITLVSAMFCRKAIVATRSTGIADYVPESCDSLFVEAGDVEGWVVALRTMAADAARRERCAAQGEEFALANCSHEAAFRGTMETFRRVGIEIS